MKIRLGAFPWIFPALAMIAVFVVWPAFEMIRTSFQEIDPTGIAKGWAGLENYRTLFENPDLKPVLVRTLFWVTGIVFFHNRHFFTGSTTPQCKFSGTKVSSLGSNHSLGCICSYDFNNFQMDSRPLFRSA